jgi:hypothetical protein
MSRKPVAGAEVADEIRVSDRVDQVHNLCGVANCEVRGNSGSLREMFDDGTRHLNNVASGEILITEAKYTRPELIGLAGFVGRNVTLRLKRVKNAEDRGSWKFQLLGDLRNGCGPAVLAQVLEDVQTAIQRGYGIVRLHAIIINIVYI